MLSLAVFGSGSGSNFQSIVDAIEAGSLNARVACVISDVEDAYILERARKQGIPAEYCDCTPFTSKIDGKGEQAALEIIRRHNADFIVLAGFMRMIKAGLLNAFPGRVVNIHPALLPNFPGLASWEQALDSGAKITGCTVHFVDKGMDTGPIILQRSVPVLDDDTPESLHARIQKQEYIAYPMALKWISEGRTSIEGRKVRIKHPNIIKKAG